MQVREAHPDPGARALRSRAARLSIGMHWDKDEDLVDQQGINIHPHLSTVTYLSDAGAPTLVSKWRPVVLLDIRASCTRALRVR